MHVALAFELLKDDRLNVLSHWLVEDRVKFRNLVITIVLGTDMAMHLLVFHWNFVLQIVLVLSNT